LLYAQIGHVRHLDTHIPTRLTERCRPSG
jgi:hypothetical protein